MSHEMDRYIDRCLKNWTAKFQPPADGRARLLERALEPPAPEPAPFSSFFAAFTNRWSSSGEHYYSQRQWQIVRSEIHSINWSLGFAVHQKLTY